MAAAPPSLRSEIESFMARRRVPGMVAGLVRGGEAQAWGFGRVAAGGPAPNARTVFEIGSITKVVTGLVLARLVAEGRTSLDQPIRSLLEGRVALPDWGGHEPTLRHLATHSATLPRASRRMLAGALRDRANPYRDYGEDKLYADLADLRIGAGLGQAFEYSNLGAGLLGHLLTLVAGRDYEALARDVAQTLGLDDTTITLGADQHARLAQGHQFGKPVGLWDMGVLAGAGALRSTAADLLLFLQSNLGRRSGPLDAVLQEAQQPLLRVSDTLSIGLFWHLSPLGGVPGRPTVAWHRGETGGMRGFLSFLRERALGLVLLANAAVGVDELGLELLAQLGAPPTIERTPDGRPIFFRFKYRPRTKRKPEG